jgi:GT2 family glycosyltransferase
VEVDAEDGGLMEFAVRSGALPGAPEVGGGRDRRMRVLGHIHTFNEEEVIDRSLSALLDQTYPVDEVLLVDNASTDNTLNRRFPDTVTVIRHTENMLTSAAIITAMRYAMERGYDWIWILNGDSAPRQNALEKLVELYRGFSPDLQEQVWLLATLPVDATTQRPNHGFLVTSGGLREIRPPADDAFYECDATIWSGSLYKVAAVQQVGLPRLDYPMDMAEIEYGYRGRRRGYRAFLHLGSVMDHNIAGPSLQSVEYRLGPVTVRLAELRPYRCYYVVGNVLDFWLYEYRDRTVFTYAYCLLKVAKLMASFLVRPISRRRELAACFHGVWDGVRRRINPRYLQKR